MINVEKLNPFGRMCVSLGMLPSSYKESLTYEEQLLWFFKYLDEKVIPTLNNNADAIIQLQSYYNELKTYVDEYFDNLDVQEEINNKLDDMAEQGELTEIIAQYLQLAGVLAYNTLDDLEAAENIINGSICLILGKDTYNDGKSAYYKIREIKNTDVVDGDNIVAITYDDDLVGEKISNYEINSIKDRLDELETNNDEIIINGDSYGNESGEWSYVLKNLLVTNKDVSNANKVHIVCSSGASAIKREGTNFPTYLENLQSIENNISNKDKVKSIILCGGYNDNNKTTGELITAFTTYYNYCKTNYPNANIYFGMIGWSKNIADSQIRANLVENVLRAYQNVGSFGGIYLNNIEYIMHNYQSDVWSEDGYHPSVSYGNTLGYKIYQAYKNGNLKDSRIASNTISTGFFTNTFTLYSKAFTDILEVSIDSTVLGSPLNTYTLNNDYLQTIDFGVQNLDLIRKVSGLYTRIEVNLILLGTMSDTSFRTSTPAYLTIDNNGHLILNYFHPYASNSNPTITNAIIETRTSISRINV